MKRWFALSAVVFLAGCGIKEEIYNSEVAQRKTCEQQAQALQTNLEAETKRRVGVEKNLSDVSLQKTGLEGELKTAREASARLQGSLTASSQREQQVNADLEACRGARTAAEGERDRLKEALGMEKGGRAEETRKSLELIGERDRLRSEVAAEKSGRAADQQMLAQARAERERQATAYAAERAALSGERDRLAGEGQSLRAKISDLEAQLAQLREEKRRTEQEKQDRLDEMTKTYEGLLKGMKSEVERGDITISQLKGKLTVNVLDEILFDSGSALIKPKGMDVLKRVGEVLNTVTDKTIVIEGHTDTQRIGGELSKVYPTNWELSTARATSVVRYLEDKAKMDPKRLSAVGFGPYRPVDTNETAEGRAKNRRIEIKLVPLESPLFGPGSEKESPAKP